MKAKDIKPLRDQLLQDQEGLCALCGHLCPDPVLDHSHFSGKIRGTICRTCNVALGRFENGAVRAGCKLKIQDIADRIGEYLRNEREEIHPSHGKKKRKKRVISPLV